MNQFQPKYRKLRNFGFLLVAIATFNYNILPTSSITITNAASGNSLVSEKTSTIKSKSFLYRKIEGFGLNMYSVGAPYTNTIKYIRFLSPYTHKMWLAPDGSGRIHRTDGTPNFLSKEDQTMWETAGKPDLSPSFTTDHKAGELNDPRVLPVERIALAQTIHSRVKDNDSPIDYAMFNETLSLMVSLQTKSELRRSLFEVMASIPNVKVQSNVADRQGRVGVSLSYTDSQTGQKIRVIVDPQTYYVLSDEIVLLKPSSELNVSTPFTLSWTTYSVPSTVSSIEEKP
jgi:hypothetical protein